MKKISKKTFNVLKVCIILVAVLSCGIYYVAFSDNSEEEETKIESEVQIPEISFEITITEGENVVEKSEMEEGDTLKININTASSDLLEELPNVGPAVAANIIAYREENGPFKNIDDILNVKGIGQAKYNLIKDSITVNE